MSALMTRQLPIYARPLLSHSSPRIRQIPISRSLSLWPASTPPAEPSLPPPTVDIAEAITLENVIPTPTVLEPFSQVFLSIADSLPFEASYVALIPLLTLLIRTSTTLPLTMWQRARTRKFEEVAMPLIRDAQRQLEVDLRREGRETGKGYNWYRQEFSKRVKKASTQIARSKGCSPLPTMLIPPLVHIPIFITTTLILRDACALSLSSLDSANSSLPSYLQDLALTPLLQLPSLALPDPTLFLPLAVGLAVLLNVEVGATNRMALQRSRDALRGAMRDETRARDHIRVATPSAAEARRIMAQRARRSFSTLGVVRREALTTREMAAKEKAKLAATIAAKELQEDTPEEDKEPLTARVITNILRFSSVLFIPIAAMAPAAVCVYWLTSNTFTLAQNMIFNVIDRRRLGQALEARQALKAAIEK